MRSIINNAELAAVNGGMTVYESQDQYPSTAQRASALNNMSSDEIKEIIDRCRRLPGSVQRICRCFWVVSPIQSENAQKDTEMFLLISADNNNRKYQKITQ